MINAIKFLIPLGIGQKKTGLEKGVSYISNYYKNIKSEKFKFNSDNKKVEIYNKLKNDVSKIKNKYDYFLFIGGDHSISLGSISGLYSNTSEDDICVIWLDAHTDINIFSKSKTGNIHGMPLAGLLGELEKPYKEFKCLNHNQICYFGTRSIDDYEKEYIKKNNIKNITMNDINKDLNGSLNELKNFINNRNVHLSFDVDIMDPSIISSTGVLEKDGMNIIQMKKTLEYLKQFNIKSTDIVEFNPELGNKEKSLNELKKLLDILILK